MEKQEYKLETSHDGKTWRLKAIFLENEMSRFELPFNAEIAIKEAEQFIDFYKNVHKPATTFKHVRIIIDIQQNH